MVVRGRVRNGVVVVNDDIRLPEGEEVTIVGGSKGFPVSHDVPAHSVLDIPAVSLGAVLAPLASDDLLGEMLEARS